MPATATPRQLARLLVVMCAALAMVVGANSSLSLAIPDIAGDTGATQTELSWIVNAYALVFAGLLLPVGIAADKYGRRGALVIGLVIFAAASGSSGLLDDPAAIIALRAIAGAGAAAVMPATLSVLVDVFPPARRTFAISVWAGVSGAGALLGVVLSGVLVEVAWWGSVQVTYGVVGVLLIPMVWLVVPPSRNPELSVDPVGGALSLVGLSALVYGVIEGGERGWSDPLAAGGLVVGVAFLLLFVAHELRTSDPMLDVRLFRSRGLTAGSVLVFVQFFAAFAFFFLAPQFLQFVQGDGALVAALSLLPIAVGIAPASNLAPALLRRFGAAYVGAVGAALMAVPLALFALLADDFVFWQFAIVLVAFGLGFGLAVTPGTELIIAGLPADRRTLSAAVNDVTREMGGALGGSVAASVLLAVYANQIVTATGDLPEPAAEAAGEGIASALTIAGEFGPLAPDLANVARAAFTDGYSLALVVGAVALLIAAILCAVLAPRQSVSRRTSDR